jgi:adenosylcobinamide kinase/adenosylcobinamide-phosphate guanylyltransferase
MSMGPHHLILGGQRSGKSRHAERLAMRWVRQSPAHRVTVVATALASDDEMHQRIERHRADRPSGFDTVEAPHALGLALRQHASPGRLLVVDCLTLWLTNVLMPAHPGMLAVKECALSWAELRDDLLSALADIASPVLLVSNEIGWGVIPLGAEVRRFVDELGRLNQEVAQRCELVTLMAAGQPWTQAVQRWDR